MYIHIPELINYEVLTDSSCGSALTCLHNSLMASLPILSVWQTDSKIALKLDASSPPLAGDNGGEGTVIEEWLT